MMRISEQTSDGGDEDVVGRTLDNLGKRNAHSIDFGKVSPYLF